MEINFKKSIKKLIKHGHAQFDTDLKKADFEKCMLLQRKVFRLIGKEGLEKLYCTDYHKEEHDKGFFRRRKDEKTQKKDEKDCGHYRPTLRVELEWLWGREIAESDIVNDYLIIAKKIYLSLHSLAKEILGSVDTEIGSNLLAQFLDPEASDLHTLRTIGYLAPKENLEVADYHYDRDLITLAAYESHKGLRIEKNNKLVPYTYVEGKVLVFWGEKAELLTNGILKASVHGVRVFLKGVKRNAIVFFGHSLKPLILKSKKIPEHFRIAA